MSTETGLSFTGRVRSAKYAMRGIWIMIGTQHNAWIHAAATVAMVSAGVVCKLTVSELLDHPGHHLGSVRLRRSTLRSSSYSTRPRRTSIQWPARPRMWRQAQC